MPQEVCFQYGQTGHVKKYCPLLSNTGSVGQSLVQPSTSVQSFGRLAVRSAGLSRSMVGSSFGTQGVQQPQRTQTRIFAMTIDEAKANPETVTCIMFVFGTPTRVLFNSGSSRSFVSSSFALHADQDLSPIKSKLVVTTPLGE